MRAVEIVKRKTESGKVILSLQRNQFKTNPKRTLRLAKPKSIGDKLLKANLFKENELDTK